jgi:pyrimidine operon attenuation protein/uracil phosphoribosyltransferase
MGKAPVEILDAAELRRVLTRLASEILEQHPDPSRTVLLGIRTRGVPLAHRLARQIELLEANHLEASPSKMGTETPHPVAVGALDITFYRDDLHRLSMRTPSPSEVPCDLTGQQVILVDDVIYRGRTIRAALDALNDFGRPDIVRLAVLIDRGHRELPIHPDYVGKVLPTAQAEIVRVHMAEVDGEDRVFLEQP